MKRMKRKKKELTYLELNKIMMQESGAENTIFTEVQVGPQEEPMLREDYMDVEQFERYKEEHDDDNRVEKF